MTPEEILRDALDKIAAQRRADEERLASLKSEVTDLGRRLAEAFRMEVAIKAILSGTDDEPALILAPAAVKVTEPAAPVPVDAAPAQVPEAKVVALPAAAAAPAPPAEAVQARETPAAADPVGKALELARAAAPDKTERQQKMLAAAAHAVAFGLTRREAATLFGLGAHDLAPSFLCNAKIYEKLIESVARAIRKGAADEPGGRPTISSPVGPRREAVATSEPAKVEKVPQPAPAAASQAVEDPTLKLLVTDLPQMAANAPGGVSVDIIAEWFGWPLNKAERAAEDAVAQGLATSPYPGAILPAKAAVPA